MQLAKYTEKYTKELRRWIEPLFIEKQPEQTTERNCISLGPKELSLIRINNLPDTNELISSDTLRFEDYENIPGLLSGLMNRYNLSSTPTYWLLSPEDYQLFLIESLPVEKNEFKEAVTWRIRSLINYPIEETIIDCFKLPPKKTSIENMVAAIVTRRTQLTPLIDIFKKAKLNLTTIDIPELAMRNLTAPYENDEKSTAFIYFYERLAILNITRQKTLYFTRRINLSSEADTPEGPYQQINLDLLRYFDYFQSQWRFPSPNRIFIASEKLDAVHIAKKLSEYLSLPVEPYRLKSILGNPKILQTLEKKNLLMLGCALREAEDHVRPTS